MATTSERRPAVIGLRLNVESSPNCVSRRRFLKALNAALICSLLGGSTGTDMIMPLQFATRFDHPGPRHAAPAVPSAAHGRAQFNPSDCVRAKRADARRTARP